MEKMEFNSLLICSLAILFVGTAMGQGYGRRPPRCPPVCANFCKYGRVFDYNNCPTCECNPAPCPEDSKAVVPERGCTGPSLRPALLPLHGQCGRGAFCSTRIPSEKGKCCIKKRPVVSCPGNSKAVEPKQTCNELRLGNPLLPLHDQCGRGTFCSTRNPFETGICCVDHIEEPHCPVNNIFTPCVVTKDSCTSSLDCNWDEKCCPIGCGKQCVPRFGAGYIPRRPRLPPSI